ERKLLVAAHGWPGGIPEAVEKQGDAPAGVSTSIAPTPVGVPVQLRLSGDDAYRKWETANVVRGVAKNTVSAYAYARLGDVTAAQFRALASIQRELACEV